MSGHISGSRKLACTKEPAGCSRCRREGIACHYSPQKRMGRPRKRRFVEEEEDSRPVDDDASGEEIVSVAAPGRGNKDHQERKGPDVGYLPARDNISASLVPVPTTDAGLSFLDESSTPNFDFLDLLPTSYHETTQIDPQILVPSDSVVDGSGFPFAFNHGADLLGAINFDEPDTATNTDMSKLLTDSLAQHWTSMPAQNEAPERPESFSSGLSQSADSPGSLSGPSSSSATTAQGGDDEFSPQQRADGRQPWEERHDYDHDQQQQLPRVVPSIACGCLSSLYLALDSLSRLPSDIPSAMRVARNATRVAHDVIKCPYCSDSLIDDPTRPPPIQCFQNLMFLAALVPSACNAYAGILEMLDREAAAARREGRTIYFSFKEIGGLWGALADGPRTGCNIAQSLNNQRLAPDAWRNTMRAILRLDVYGFTDNHHSNGGESGAPKCHQNGLKDVVRLLEERSARRHDMLDEMVAQGTMPHTHYMVMPGPYKPVPPEERNCIKILDAARIALENLVIA